MSSVSASVLKRITKELYELDKSPLEGIRVFLNEENIVDIQAMIEGPLHTPFEGGEFRVKLALGSDFPSAPPKGYFITKLFHPNVGPSGDICVSTLKKDWKPTLGIKDILLTIKCLLIAPNPESALNEEAGKLLLEDYQAYFKHAKLMTSIHASSTKSSLPNGVQGEVSPADIAPAAVPASTFTNASIGVSSSPIKRPNPNFSISASKGGVSKKVGVTVGSTTDKKKSLRRL